MSQQPPKPDPAPAAPATPRPEPTAAAAAPAPPAPAPGADAPKPDDKAKAVAVKIGTELRRHGRFPVPRGFALLVLLEHPGGSRVSISPRARDLSASGVSFTHVAYLHPGTACSFMMKTREREVVKIPGAIVRCRHTTGRNHDVGAVFENEIDVGRFISGADAVTPAVSRTVPAAELHKRVAALAMNLQQLAERQAALDTLLVKVGEIAQMLIPAEADEHPAAAPPAEHPAAPEPATAPAAEAPAPTPAEAPAATSPPAGAPAPSSPG